MSETSGTRPRFRFRVFILEGMFLIAIAIVLLLVFLGPVCAPQRPMPSNVLCMRNLRDLGLALVLYANGYGDRYPPAKQWCDLLARQHSRETGESTEKFRKAHRCPKVATDGWGYALNPLARQTGDPNVVLAFESDAGWNGFGGPESVVTGRHRGEGANVLFVDGHVEFVKVEKLAALKWQDAGIPLPEARSNQRENREE